MPSVKTLSAEQIQRFRDQLSEQRDRLLSEVDGVVESMRQELNPNSNLSSAPVHMADVAPEQLDADTNVVETEREMMEATQAALDRIDQGTFGTCSDCGNAIQLERLQAVPHAHRCISCARKHTEGAAR